MDPTEDLTALELSLRSRSGEAHWLAVRRREAVSRQEDVLRLTAEVGLRPSWSATVDRETARLVLIRLASQSLAYDWPLRPELLDADADGAAFADDFLGRFSLDATLATNMVTAGEFAWQCWDPLTEHTFDLGLAAVDDARVGLVAVAEED